MMNGRWRGSRWSVYVLGMLMASAAARGQEPADWQQDLTASFQHAQKINRSLVIVLTKEHCSSCNRLKSQTLTDHRLQEILAQQFVAVRVDGTEHPDLLRRAAVRVYPTILVISPDNELVSRVDGFVEASALISKLTRLRTAQLAQPDDRKNQ